MDSGRRAPRARGCAPVALGIGILCAGLLLWGCAKKRRAAGVDAVYAGLAKALEGAGRRGDAKEVRRACGGKAGRTCACIRTASRLALDRDLSAESLAVLAKAPPGCALLGQRAEAHARARKLAEASALLGKALAADPRDPFAAYARAHIHYVRGAPDRALEAARVAIGRGRGPVAHLLVGLIALSRRQYPAALSAFEAVRKLDPADAGARYNIALVHHRQNHYRLAREGYLAALRLHRGLANARYNLVLLTHNAGVKAESRHHLRKLRELIPSDPRLARLRVLLSRPPRNPSRRRPGPARPAPMAHRAPAGAMSRAAGASPRPAPAARRRAASGVPGQTGPVGPR